MKLSGSGGEIPPVTCKQYGGHRSPRLYFSALNGQLNTARATTAGFPYLKQEPPCRIILHKSPTCLASSKVGEMTAKHDKQMALGKLTMTSMYLCIN